MGGVEDLVMVLLVIGGGYYLWSTGELDKLLQGVKLPTIGGGGTTPGPSAPAPPPSGGGGGPPAPRGGGGGGAAPAGPGGTKSTGAGDCSKTIYAATGQVKDNSKQTKDGTRHYASGKPDDVTAEWGTSVSFKNYEFTAYFTITKVDHDDTVSMKFGGTHNGSGWYDNGISFNGGKCCMGKEENHPSTDLCVVTGKSIGSILNKKIGMKNIIVGAGSAGAELEMWVDPQANGQWQLACPRQKGVGGFFPSSAKQECTIRIDAAPGITMHCSAVQEITGFSGSGGGAAPPAGGAAPTTPAAPEASEGGGEDSGGGGEDEGGGEDSESNYGRVNRSYSSRVNYY